MAKVIVKQKTKKVKKKYPVEFVAPELFNSKSLGNARVSDLGNIVGKTIAMNMMYVAESVKFQNIRLTFKVSSVDSGKAQTHIQKYEQVPYYLSRFIKKDSDLVEINESVVTKDGVELVVKMFIVTKSRVSHLVLTQIREKSCELIKTECANITYENLMSNIVYSKIQQGLRNELKKITPLKVFEFKKVEVISL